MNEPLCACGQLWKTPVENQLSRGRDSMPFVEDKSSTRDPLVDALIEAVDALAARIDGLEYQLLQLIGIIDQPLSPSESIRRLRQLREEITA